MAALNRVTEFIGNQMTTTADPGILRPGMVYIVDEDARLAEGDAVGFESMSGIPNVASGAECTYQDALLNALAWMEAAMHGSQGKDAPRGRGARDGFQVTCDIIGLLVDSLLSGFDPECSVSHAFDDQSSISELEVTLMNGCSLSDAFKRGGE